MSSRIPSELLFDMVDRTVESTQKLYYIRPKSGNGTFTSQNGAPASLRFELPRILSADLKQSYASYSVSVVDAGGAANRQLSGGGSIVRGERVLINGREEENLERVNQYRQLIADMECDDAKLNSNWEEGFGTNAELQTRAATSNSLNDSHVYSPSCGLFNQEKILPLYAMGGAIEVEFDFASTNEACTASAGSVYYSVVDFKLAIETHQLSQAYTSQVLKALESTGFDILMTSYKWSSYILNSTYNAPRINLKKRSVKGLLCSIQASTNLNNLAQNWEYIPDNLSSIRLNVGGELYPSHDLPFGAETKKELGKLMGNIGMLGEASQLTRANYGVDKAIFGLNTEHFLAQKFMTGMDWSIQDALLELNHTVAPANSQLNMYVFYDVRLNFKMGSIMSIQ